MNGWHLAEVSHHNEARLRYGDRRLIETGRWLSVKGEPQPCEWGLHASPNITDTFSTASILCYNRVALCEVIVDGRIKEDIKKFVGNRRYVVSMLTLEQTSEFLDSLTKYCAYHIAKEEGYNLETLTHLASNAPLTARLRNYILERHAKEPYLTNTQRMIEIALGISKYSYWDRWGVAITTQHYFENLRFEAYPVSRKTPNPFGITDIERRAVELYHAFPKTRIPLETFVSE